MKNDRYELSDDVKAIRKEIAEMERAIKNARWSLDPANNPNKEDYPIIEKAFRVSVWSSLINIGFLIDKFIENGSEVFADPTIGRDKK